MLLFICLCRSCHLSFPPGHLSWLATVASEKEKHFNSDSLLKFLFRIRHGVSHLANNVDRTQTNSDLFCLIIYCVRVLCVPSNNYVLYDIHIMLPLKITPMSLLAIPFFPYVNLVLLSVWPCVGDYSQNNSSAYQNSRGFCEGIIWAVFYQLTLLSTLQG